MATGPRRDSFGSWVWVGEDISTELKNDVEVHIFERLPPEDVEVVVWVKELPDIDLLKRRRGGLPYHVLCPVDLYNSVADIDANAESLLEFDLIIVHTPRLLSYSERYAPTIHLDDHVKFVLPTRTLPLETGHIFWVSVRSHLGPVLEFLNNHEMPASLAVLTNSVQPSDVNNHALWGCSKERDVHIETWSPENHLKWLTRCRLAIHIKGEDFHSRHKPATNAFDFLASGIPLPMNAGSSSVYVARLCGFNIATPENTTTWLSRRYAERTQAFGRQLSAELSLQRLAQQWTERLRRLLDRTSRSAASSVGTCNSVAEPRQSGRATHIGLVSALFNRPSTGGGTAHSADTARFLSRAGYDVRHFVIQYDDCKLGQVRDHTDWPIERLVFSRSEWQREQILDRIRCRVCAFSRDAVILTDSWSFKPCLAAALRGTPCYLRLTGEEVLCA